MNWHPFLSRVEVFLFRLLIKSPRVGMIIVKQKGELISWVLRDQSDSDPFQDEEADSVPWGYETPAQQLERLYHAPDADHN
jgi:hypothetical protein